MKQHDKEYWDERWRKGETGWDLGEVSPPLKRIFDQLENKAIDILIPGAGNAYEAEYLYEQGFKRTNIVEISPNAIDSFQERYPSFPKSNIHNSDFFELTGNYDLIVEQTFFCALDPELRPQYVQKMHELLKVKSGKLVGLLFDFPLAEGPPYGGSIAHYCELFEPLFEIQLMETARHSIKPRAGRELFITFVPR